MLVKVEAQAVQTAIADLGERLVTAVEDGDWDAVEAHSQAIYGLARGFTVPGRQEPE